ncbi:MAG: TonB-dependent receptor domain-containing protein [Gammaproteobacteria bacterium]
MHLHTPLAAQGPVEQISAAEIKRSGLTTIGQLLARLPIMGSGLNRTFNFNGNGDTYINLRNLGSQRVLVLVNGRRWAPSLNGEVDLNTIPLAIVDHVDILKSGDSAIYGSAAMAGVVNIVTRKNVTGLQLNAYGGTFVEGSERDGQTQSYSLTDGIGNDRGNITFTLSYLNQQPVGSGDRAISAVPNYGTGVTRGTSTTAQGRFIFINPNTGQREDLTTISGTPGNSPADFRPFNPLTDFYNFAPVNYLWTPMKQTGIYLQGHYRFTSNLSGHLSTLYNDRRSHQREGPAELHIGSQTAFPISISETNPYNPFGFDLDATGSNPNLLLIARQPVELGPRYVHEDVQTFYVNPGLSGDFNLAGVPFQWRADAILSRTRFTTTDGIDINMARVATALGPVDDCGPDTPNPTCVPLNLFGGQYHGGTITPAMIKYIDYTALEYQQNDLRDYTASVTAEPLRMAGGPLRVTAGVEHRNESGSFQPDPLSAAGIGSQSEGTPISGGYHVDAGFLSADIPLLGGIDWVKSLHVNLATRASHFNTFGTIKSNLAALHWTINDRLSAAASWSQDFRAPSIAELFTANVTGTASVADPCSDLSVQGRPVAANCAAAGVPAGYVQVNPDVPSTTGRNPNLQPETSTSRTLSLAAVPFLDIPLSLQADYFKIGIDNAITMLNPQDILNGCYVAGRSNYCAFVARNASGAISDLTNTNQNLGSLLTEGMDFGAHYTWEAGAAGTFDFDWMTTWVKRFTFTQPNLANPAKPIVEERVDTETGKPVGGYPKFKSRLTAIWNYGPWQVLWRVNYISDLIEPCSDRYDGTPLSLTNLGLCSYPDYSNNALSKNKLGATVYYDAQMKYSFGGGNTTLTFGVLNVFDKQPPIGHSMSNSFDTTVYRIPGRFFYVGLSHDF